MPRKISGTDGRTDRGKTVYPPVERGYNKSNDKSTLKVDKIEFSKARKMTERKKDLQHAIYIYM